ncbi:hypothetical protein B0I35DRAFT_401700 [Stachybotrys elegans]|uniref:NACHT domain-containing protein n=1 Tax=Stachybotrys elegans TaxID=80388 RepID=A0A8K0SE76_9HYPO|nr:hypothetical protein B0I35DRAFT_401700 [Stachybotrys elegans]
MDAAVASTPAGSSTAGPQKALQDAIDGFHSILTVDQRDKLAHIGAIRDAQSAMIFTAQLDRETQLKKGRGVAGRFISVLQSVQAFSAVVDTFVSSNPEIAALVWGSIKFALLIVVNFTSYFEALSSLFMSFSNHCPRFSEYQALYPASTRLQKALCDFHASIIRCCKHILEAVQRPWQKQLLKAFSQSFSQEFRPDVNDIRNLAKEVTSEINLAKFLVDDQEQKLQAMERAAASKQRLVLQKFIPRMEKGLDTVNKLRMEKSMRQSREEQQKLFEFLSSHDYITPFREASKKRQCDTAEWIFATPEFSQWYYGKGPSLLWCSGKIGSGKTILCANVINHVLAKQVQDTQVTFFFLQYDHSDSLQAETTIRSIIRQSIDTISLPENIRCQLKEWSQKRFVELQAWIELAQEAINFWKSFYVFIDGLDESDAVERRALLDALSLLTSACPGLRILITSRDSVIVDLKGRFPELKRILMSPGTLSSDIGLYIEAAVQERIRNEDLMVYDPSLIDEIKERLRDHADGMFLWVTFLINELCIASCDDDIRRFLHSLPRDLEETFNRALSRIITRQRRSEVTQKVFRWVAAAKQPLALDELQEAISIDIGQEYSKPERMVRGIDHIALWCENLIQVTEGTLLVQFAHSTVHDFLVKASLPRELSGFRICPAEADHFLGEICVTYLHFNDFKTTVAHRPKPLQVNPMAIATAALGQRSGGAKLATQVAGLAFRPKQSRENPDLSGVFAPDGMADNNRRLDKLTQDHPFLQYAARHWVSHTVKFQKEKSITWRLWHHMVLIGHSLACEPWKETTARSRIDAILLWSHREHHYPLLRCSLNASILPTDERDELFELSGRQGDFGAIAVFLEAEYCSLRGMNMALRAASGGGHLQVVERLLAAGANVTPIALELASRNGHLQVFKRLLATGANRLLAAGADRSADVLEHASAAGHVQVVERLLAAGADVNADAAGFGETALYAASMGGHLQVVEQLLAAGADVNADAAGFGRTALYAASADGHPQEHLRQLPEMAVLRLWSCCVEMYFERGFKPFSSQSSVFSNKLSSIDLISSLSSEGAFPKSLVRTPLGHTNRNSHTVNLYTKMGYSSSAPQPTERQHTLDIFNSLRS